MRPRLCNIGLSMLLLVALAGQAVAQQNYQSIYASPYASPNSAPYVPYSSPQPPPNVPHGNGVLPGNVGPPASDGPGWPREELGPHHQITPHPIVPQSNVPLGAPQSNPSGAPPLGSEFTPIAQATESWVQPFEWFLPGKITGSVELGINGSDGNSEALSFKTGFELKHKTEMDELEFDLAYTKATADGNETQHNALFNASYERTLGESKWNVFVKEALEYDEFKAFDLRLAINAGIGYHIMKNDITTWNMRLGAGASTEVGGPTENWVPEGVIGTDFKRQLSKRQKVSLTSDYFPDLSDFANYRVVTKASYEVMLNEEYNLNLKLSINDRYDSTPNGRKPNDINYSVLLLWKM